MKINKDKQLLWESENFVHKKPWTFLGIEVQENFCLLFAEMYYVWRTLKYIHGLRSPQDGKWGSREAGNRTVSARMPAQPHVVQQDL